VNKMDKVSHFTILVAIIFVVSCGYFENQDVKIPRRMFNPVETVGTVESDLLTESSGIAVSRCNDDVLWSHNDSGEAPMIFAFDSSGKDLGAFLVEGAENQDWEDIASVSVDSQCRLYIADIGNNYSLRQELALYIVDEPRRVVSNLDKTLPSRKIRFTYELPVGTPVPDAETVMVHPQTLDVYLVTKEKAGPASVFRISAADVLKGSAVAKKIGEVSVPSIPPGLITGGDISPDGTRVTFVDYLGAYEFSLSERSEEFSAIFSKTPTLIRLGNRTQGEAISYSKDGKALFATSEGSNSPILMVRSK
jgi:hypothetical protein